MARTKLEISKCFGIFWNLLISLHEENFATLVCQANKRDQFILSLQLNSLPT